MQKNLRETPVRDDDEHTGKDHGPCDHLGHVPGLQVGAEACHDLGHGEDDDHEAKAVVQGAERGPGPERFVEEDLLLHHDPERGAAVEECLAAAESNQPCHEETRDDSDSREHGCGQCGGDCGRAERPAARGDAQGLEQRVLVRCLHGAHLPGITPTDATRQQERREQGTQLDHKALCNPQCEDLLAQNG